MRITNDCLNNGKYIILSYDHSNKGFSDELAIYDDAGLCYWYDKAMDAGSDGYDEQFYKALDHENCVGIVFFLTERFFLSEPCIAELRYFTEKHVQEKTGKLHLLVVSHDFKLDIDDMFDKVDLFAEENIDDFPVLKKLRNRELRKELDDRIDNVWKLAKEGKVIYGILGNKNDYVKKAWFLKKGLLNESDISEIVNVSSVKQQLKIRTYGLFPQSEERSELIDLDPDKVPRQLDNKDAFYAPVEWFVLSEDEDSTSLMSRKLLFAIDYLDLRYPLQENSKTVSEAIRDKVKKLLLGFEDGDIDTDITEVRFVTRDELENLILLCKNPEQKKELLTPETTFFSKATDSENAPAYWLAGDMEDARRVDACMEGFSDLKPGIETFYVRIVIVVKKES